MIFETVATGGCRSYIIGCEESCTAALIDPELSQIDRYVALAAKDGLRIRYLVDTHTHADHFSATQELARQLRVPVVMHSASPAALRTNMTGNRHPAADGLSRRRGAGRRNEGLARGGLSSDGGGGGRRPLLTTLIARALGRVTDATS
jgi:glyoxylase-like metal-dependent hydrolase (beta-lactamase superfamily II)